MNLLKNTVRKTSLNAVNFPGVKLLIDNKALMYIIGTKMDYVEDEIKSEFIFINPNSKGSCGCGESFNV
jgi:iron-sulfur cluster assembly accessory protein